MTKKATLRGVQAIGTNRIHFDFWFAGTRRRPPLNRIPSGGNLRRAHKQLKAIKQRIEERTFNFEEEVPNYRFIATVPTGENAR